MIEKPRARSRHLGDSTHRDEMNFMDHLVDWLNARGFAGSVADDYSLYRAVQDEFERARQARKRRN